MIFKIRIFLWKILGVDYKQVLKIHDYTYLNNDPYAEIGKHTYHNGALVFRWTKSPIKIGNFCSIANDVKFIVDEAFHSSSLVTSYPLINNLHKKDLNLNSGKNKEEFLELISQKKGIVVGHDVWIGMGAYIMPGVTIGNGVTIAANSVVTKDVEDYVVVGGSPAKIISRKFEPKIVEYLNQISWWYWDTEKIKDRIEDFYEEKNDFINKHKIHNN